MAAAPSPAKAPANRLRLVWGDDEFSVKVSAKRAYEAWCAETGGFDHEIIDGAAANASEAVKALARTSEALQTLPFFGGAKVVWLQHVSFLGDERTASAQAVVESLAGFTDVLKSTPWDSVRLIISAGKVDRRKAFYKFLEKSAEVEMHSGLSADDRDWVAKAEMAVVTKLKELGRQMSDAAVADLIECVGPNLRGLANELEKLSVFRADGGRIEAKDVDAVVPRQRQAKAFALGEAVGERDLPKALRLLEEELWSLRTDAKKSEISLLYGLITKVRLMLMAKELVRLGALSAQMEYGAVAAKLPKIPPETFPADLPFSPLRVHAFQMFKALQQSQRFSSAELIQALALLLETNHALVSSSVDAAVVLQRVLVRILATAPGAKREPAAAPSRFSR